MEGMEHEGKSAKRFVVEFGSHAKVHVHPDVAYVPGSSPRDIDAFFYGMEVEEARAIVVETYPSWTGPIDLHEYPYGLSMYCTGDDGLKMWMEPFVDIPIPYERWSCGAWRILHSSPAVPKVKLKSMTGSLPTILREGKGWEKALERIEGLDGITLCLEDRDESVGIRFDDNHYGENSDRTAVSRAALLHFGEDDLHELCQRLWWGPFLEKFVREKPSKEGLAECEKHCPMGGRTSVMIGSFCQTFFGGYGPYFKNESGEDVRAGWTLEEFIALLF